MSAKPRLLGERKESQNLLILVSNGVLFISFTKDMYGVKMLYGNIKNELRKSKTDQSSFGLIVCPQPCWKLQNL